ncbi:MAG: ATP-binding cassette domain-containing protein [Chthoniobacteraceae bacterium]
MENGAIILEARGVSCAKAPANEPLARLQDVSLSIHAKTLNLLSGDEVSGRGLLLRLLGLLDAPDEGEIYFHGAGTRGLAEEARAEIRNQRYGFLFSQPFLLPSFSVIENVAMPLFKISGADAQEAQQRTEAMLEFAGMMDFAESPVEQLTFVQQQRVSLARALVNQPEILIVENMEAGIGGEELAHFIDDVQRVVAEFGMTAILTAGSGDAGKFSGRVIELEGGAVRKDSLMALKEGGAEA